MTARQNFALALVARKALEAAGENAEFKDWTVTALGEGKYSRISVVVETGKIGDEGKMSAIFCRPRAHFFIGRRGGIESADLLFAVKADRTRLRKYPLIYGFRTVGSR